MWSHLPIGTGPSVTHRLRDPALIPTTKYSQTEQQSTLGLIPTVPQPTWVTAETSSQIWPLTEKVAHNLLWAVIIKYGLLSSHVPPSVTAQKTLNLMLLFLSVCVLQSVVRCLWHPKLNQIMAGTGNGLAKVYYDPVKSHRYVQLFGGIF